MNLLLLLSVVTTFCCGYAQLQTSTENLTKTCTITIYQGVLYNVDNLLGHNQWLRADTLQECGTICLREKGCKAINFDAKKRECALLGSGLPNANADKSLYDKDGDVVHGLITCNRRPSGPVNCGTQAAAYQPDFRQNRIIRGKQAKPHSWPWLVAMEIDLRNGNKSNCGSSLLRIKDNVDKSDIILTAAHCITEEKTQGSNPKAFDAAQITIIAGEHNMDKYDDGEESRTGAEVRFHPRFKFTPATGEVYDLALVKLDIPIAFTDTIRPICLPRSKEELPVGKKCVAAGWGRNNSNNKDDYPTTLQQKVSRVHNETICKQGWSSTYKKRIHMSAGALNGLSGICHGDSGGMLACKDADGRWKLYGVPSFVVGDDTCLEAGRPGVFTRLSSFIHWINKNMNEMTSIK